MVFYRNLLGAARSSSRRTRPCGPIAEVVKSFEMPGQHHRELHPQVGADRDGRHLRPAHPPRRGARAGAARTGASGTSRASTATARRPARSSPTCSTASTRPPSRFEEKRDAHQAKLLARGQAYESGSRRTTAGVARRPAAAPRPGRPRPCTSKAGTGRGRRALAHRAVVEAERAAVPRAGDALRRRGRALPSCSGPDRWLQRSESTSMRSPWRTSTTADTRRRCPRGRPGRLTVGWQVVDGAQVLPAGPDQVRHVLGVVGAGRLAERRGARRGSRRKPSRPRPASPRVRAGPRPARASRAPSEAPYAASPATLSAACTSPTRCCSSCSSDQSAQPVAADGAAESRPVAISACGGRLVARQQVEHRRPT